MMTTVDSIKAVEAKLYKLRHDELQADIEKWEEFAFGFSNRFSLTHSDEYYALSQMERDLQSSRYLAMCKLNDIYIELICNYIKWE